MMKSIRTLVRQDREKYVIPRRVQDVIPIQKIWEDGIFLTGGRYAKTFRFTDINYQVASEPDKEKMFRGYSALINSLDCGATTKITIFNHKMSQINFEKSILMPMQWDGLDDYREEYNQMLLDKATNGNGIIQEKFLTVSVRKKDVDAARSFFAAHPLVEPLARTRMLALAPADKPRAAAQAAEKAQAKLDDALAVYLTGTLEPAQKAYNEHYVCDYPLGLAGLDQYRAQHESLVRIDLERYAARLEQAQRDCKDRFRKDILFRMKDDIFNARRQFRELNKVMEQLTYGEEVYRFELEPSRDPQLAAFYQVIVDKGNQQMTEGDSLDNLAATADPAYERQVDELMEKIMADVDENTRARQEGRTGGVTLSDYVDYRTYLDYDIKVTNRVTGQQAYLSRVSRDSSGGENQAPFYVAICASLLQIYQKSENSIRLVLLDEAFSKMTSDRIRPMMELFRRLQLQVLLISTVEKSTAIQPYCDITYSIVRHGDANAIAPFYRAGTHADAPEKETEYE